jgi:hypothetical protein
MEGGMFEVGGRMWNAKHWTIELEELNFLYAKH